MIKLDVSDLFRALTRVERDLNGVIVHMNKEQQNFDPTWVLERLVQAIEQIQYIKQEADRLSDD